MYPATSTEGNGFRLSVGFCLGSQPRGCALLGSVEGRVAAWHKRCALGAKIPHNGADGHVDDDLDERPRANRIGVSVPPSGSGLFDGAGDSGGGRPSLKAGPSRVNRNTSAEV